MSFHCQSIISLDKVPDDTHGYGIVPNDCVLYVYIFEIFKFITLIYLTKLKHKLRSIPSLIIV